MEIKTKITPEVIQAATAILTPFVPEINAAGLVEALKEYNKKDKGEPALQKPYTRQEVAALLGLSLQTVNRMLNSGMLRRIHVGLRSVRIDPASVRNIIENGLPKENGECRA